MNGTPRELLPIAEQVLDWVGQQRRSAPYQTEYDNPVDPDDVRRIELCALATRDAAMFFDLYGGSALSGHIDHIGGDPHGETADLQGQRSEAEGLPGAPQGGHGSTCPCS